MKILYLRTLYWFNLKAGGSVTHTAGVINSMSKKVDLKIISNDNLYGVKSKVEILKPTIFSFLTSNINELFYNFKVIRYCKNIQSDIIYQRYNGFSFCGAYLAKKKNIPFVLEFNSSDVWKIKHWKIQDGFWRSYSKKIYNFLIKLPIVGCIERYNIRNATKIIVVSDALKKSLVDAGCKDGKIIVNPNGVDENKYDSFVYCEDIKIKYDLKDKIIIGFMGTFGQWHGVENIVSAYKKLLGLYPEYISKTKLFIVGDGVRMNIVKESVKDFKNLHNIILTGLVSHEYSPKYLNVCDILINATVENPDGSQFFGSPTKVFEYMAMGKSIISSDMAQMSQILEHKKTAFMVRPGDVDELMHAIKILIDDNNLRIMLGKNARNEVVLKHTWDKHVEKILECIA